MTLTPFTLLRRPTAVLLVFLCSFQLALADSGETLTYDAAQGTVSASDTNADSSNDVTVIQESGSGAQQSVQITGSAATVVNSQQTVTGSTVIEVQQFCTPTDAWCIQNASPVSVYAAVQQVTASSSNLLNAGQLAGSGSVQTADVGGSAVTDVVAGQTVTPETVINIFQDCTLTSGVCVQRALPEVLTLASQMIAATARNEINLLQQSASGAVQDALVEAEAKVNVTADQFVSPRNFLALAQTCAVDVGLCIQKAIPLIQTMARQVVDATAGNDVDLAQVGAETQNADVDASADTDVTATQTIAAQNTVVTKQECAVKKGLCLQLDASGNPVYVFSDGETVSSGSYMGTLDDSALNDGVNRQSVTTVAKGICEDGQSCTKLQQLLLWLFGPEALPEQPAQQNTGNNRPDVIATASSGHRGRNTNRIGASIRAITAMFDEDAAPGAFGGDVHAAASDEQLKAVCSVRRTLPADEDVVLVDWTARVLAERIGMDPEVTASLLKNDSLCVSDDVAAKPSLVAAVMPTFFMVDADGPLSGNVLWNKCIRGQQVTLEEVRSNPDKDGAGRPKSCGAYHTQTSWYHPDLGIYFTWDRLTGALDLPEGYVAIVHSATL